MKLFREQPDHDHWRKPFTSREKSHLWLGLSTFFILLAFLEWRHPKLPPFTGRYSWIYSSFYEFNESGILFFYILCAILSLVYGILKWLEK